MKKFLLMLVTLVFISGIAIAGNFPPMSGDCTKDCAFSGDVIVEGTTTLNDDLAVNGGVIIRNTDEDGINLITTITDGTATVQSMENALTMSNTNAGDKNFQAAKNFLIMSNANSNTGHLQAFQGQIEWFNSTDKTPNPTHTVMGGFNAAHTVSAGAVAEVITVTDMYDFRSSGFSIVSIGGGTTLTYDDWKRIWIRAGITGAGLTVTVETGLYIEDLTVGASNYGIVLDDGTDGIYLNGILSPTLLLNDDGTNGAITVNAGLDMVGIPTGTSANGALGGGEAVVGAICMSDSNEIYVDTDGSCAD